MKENFEQLKQRIAALEQEVTALKNRGYPYHGVRKRSKRFYWGLPLYDIAVGPDPEKGETRGHAKGIIAIGDIATGVLALGGVARGVIAVGGLAAGLLLSIGGLSIGLLAVGGLAIGGIALGGGAIGGIAIGGGAFGYYAVGGGAAGVHVISGLQQDPDAIQFFSDWFPEFQQLFCRGRCG
ncbi:MAG: hypothetical protein U1F42_02970 [Candidatus Competibacteraceae bacterium]